jgi:hypothetical protein
MGGKETSMVYSIEPLEADMKPYDDTYYSGGLKVMTTDNHIDLMVSRIDKILAIDNKELFILDHIDYKHFFDKNERGFKAIIIERDNYDIPSDAGDGVTTYKLDVLALLDLTINLLEKGK